MSFEKKTEQDTELLSTNFQSSVTDTQHTRMLRQLKI